MQGGIIVGLVRRADHTLINVEGTGNHAGKFASRRVVEVDAKTGEPVEIGLDDEVWWYQNNVVWTPADCMDRSPRAQGRAWDIRLTRFTGKVELVQQV